jgi:hypothetical protein
MHKKSRIKTFLSAIMLMLFLIVSLLGSEGTLLCFGKDGHLAIEFVNVCNGSGFGSQVAAAEKDACGPCIDIDFMDSPAYTRNTSHNTQTLSVISASPVSLLLPLREYPGKFIKLSESSHHQTLASLHSVVLLI